MALGRILGHDADPAIRAVLCLFLPQPDHSVKPPCLVSDDSGQSRRGETRDFASRLRRQLKRVPGVSQVVHVAVKVGLVAQRTAAPEGNHTMTALPAPEPRANHPLGDLAGRVAFTLKMKCLALVRPRKMGTAVQPLTPTPERLASDRHLAQRI